MKTFAINSRKKLMDDVEYKMSLIGIYENEIKNPISSANGIETYPIGGSTYNIYDKDIEKREKIVKEVKQKGFKNVIEEVAYTWFDRIIAIRFLELKNYLPTKTRVLSSETLGKNEPDIISEALNIDLDYSQEDKELIFKLKDENKLDELFRFLFIKQCNKLNEILPGLFEKTDDYLELLLNISFINEDGVVRQLIDTISEEDFTSQVEIIGWLYQFYNTELKDETFADVKKKKVPKERIPAVTQLFTPDWIVKYMVENSLGRLWLESHPNESLKSKWKYYVDGAEQEADVKSKLIEIKEDYKILKPEDIKVIDPCMGSGHILVYIFDVLMDIYISEGFTEKDASESILKNNLYGLDIDNRAYQLAYFAVMMKARSYNRKILTKNIVPLVYHFDESNHISKELIESICNINPKIKNDLIKLMELFNDAKNYGSMLNVSVDNLNELENVILTLLNNNNDLNYLNYQNEIKILLNIIQNAKLLSYKYDIVVTNPPYMGNNNMNSNLKEFTKKNYPISKTDLFAVFIEKCHNLGKANAVIAMITQQSFMFLSTFEKLRVNIINNKTIFNMVHLGAHAFDEIGGEVVQATSFVNKNNLIKNYNTTFHRLIEFSSEKQKEEEFFNDKNKFITNTSTFDNIPGKPIAYWADNNIINSFKIGKELNILADVKKGMDTGKNSKFLRYWFEVKFSDCGYNFKDKDTAKKSKYKWFPYNKGGDFRRWIGNRDFVVNWANDGFEIRNTKNSTIRNEKFYFKKSFGWSYVSSSIISFRYYPQGYLFDGVGCAVFSDNEYNNYILGFLNSSICQEILNITSPTLAYTVGTVAKLPLIINSDELNKINNLVENNLSICKEDYDDYETSKDFLKHPFIKFNSIHQNLTSIFVNWSKHKSDNFKLLKENEISLNKLFSKIYNIDTRTNIEDKHISINLAEYSSDVKSFISYAIGCMFGRYSLDDDGLQFAGGKFDLNNYHKFKPDDDNIIPVLDSEYFEDDIVGRFVEFVKTCFGEETLEENLDFIANALSKSNNPSREKIREYFLKNFFNDHKKTYKKCPIYWQFSSGKQNGFNCLVYMHRYEPSLVARIRTDYLHKTQKAIEQRIENNNNILNNSTSKQEVAKANKEKAKLQKQLKETQEYDEVLAHIANQNIEINLDDGVKVNYSKFQKIEIIKEGKKSIKFNLLK